MSESVDDDSESGVERHSRDTDEENSENEHARTPPLSPPHSPPSPQSPPMSGPGSICSPPQTPPSGPQSPASPPSGPQSPSSPPSGPQSPSSPINSPSSPAEQQSEDDVQISDGEASDNESVNDRDSTHEDEEENIDKHKEQSEAEDSSPEENIPEINIESADEEDEQHSDKQNVSDNEMYQAGESEDEKDDKEDSESINMQSENENKSDGENDYDHPQLSRSSPVSSPRGLVSPPRGEDDEEQMSDNDKKTDKVPSKDKEDSDGEENADSESEGDSDESEVGGLIADIFGESDDDEEFEGFKEEDIGSEKVSKDSPAKKEKKKRSAKIVSDSEDEQEVNDRVREEAEEGEGIIEDVPAPPAEEDEEEEEDKIKAISNKKKIESDESDDDGDRKMREDFVSDFDLMMQKKKEESSKRRKRKDVDLISDSDDLIADIISQMRIAAEEDKELNKLKRTATKKLKILSMVLSQLKKQDLKTAFLDQGVLNVIAEWLTPLPDRSLPHLNIREGMLKMLSDFPVFDQSLLKHSGIGRALMYLYRHPKETKENREKAGKLITEWARPIFNVTTNYHSLTKEEREQRDYDHVPKKRKIKDQDLQDEEAQEAKKDFEKEMSGEQKSVRPGDKGWIARARVPMPSTKDYINRPKWNVEMEFGRGPSKKPLNRIEKHMRAMQEKKRLSKGQRAITISIEGRKMAI